ncbi:hypothetical protein AB9P05_05345 [Roseivirga sp. BDSF3-8]|uniref:hypothetical protein n=1 Tax=Roseivirga sp. BDSF3-8 TaxID=3241598 RepID=UPI003531BC14
MLLLDLLFKICYGPFQKFKNGRTAAILWLMQILGYIILALVNAVFFSLGINLSSFSVAVIGASAGIGVLLFDKVYVKRHREVGKVRFPLLMGILMGSLVFASIFFMIFSLSRY